MIRAGVGAGSSIIIWGLQCVSLFRFRPLHCELGGGRRFDPKCVLEYLSICLEEGLRGCRCLPFPGPLN